MTHLRSKYGSHLLFDLGMEFGPDTMMSYGKPAHGTEFANFIQNERSNLHLPLITFPVKAHRRFPSNIFMFNHDPTELSRAIQSLLQLPSGTESLIHCQKTGYEAFQRARTNGIREPENLRNIGRLYEVFNQLFFFGCLTNLCAIRMEERIPGTTYLGFCRSHKNSGSHTIPNNHACLIMIVDLRTDPTNHRYKSRKQRRLNYFQTLLHEMLHAYFAIYTCDCNKSCKSNLRKYVGNGGHQSAWQDAALAIEDATKLLCAERLAMDREQSLAHDWTQSADEPPAKESVDLGRWDMKYEEVCRIFHSLKERKDKARLAKLKRTHENMN